MPKLEKATLTEEQQGRILALVESFALGKLLQSDEERLAIFQLLAKSRAARDFAEEARFDFAYLAEVFDIEIDQSGNKKLAEWILRQAVISEAGTMGLVLGTEPDNAGK